MTSSDLPSRKKTKPVRVSDSSSYNDSAEFIDINGLPSPVFVKDSSEADEEHIRPTNDIFRGHPYHVDRISGRGDVNDDGIQEGDLPGKRKYGQGGVDNIHVQGEEVQRQEEKEEESPNGGPTNPDPGRVSTDWRAAFLPDDIGLFLPGPPPQSHWTGQQEKTDEEYSSGNGRDTLLKGRGGGGGFGVRVNSDLYGASKPLPVGGFGGLSIDDMESLPFNVMRTPRNQKIVNINGEEKLIFTDIDKVKSKRRPGSGISVDGCSTLPMTNEYASLPASCGGTIPMGELPLPALDADVYCKLPKYTVNSSALSATARPKRSKKKKRRPPSHHHFIYGERSAAAATLTTPHAMTEEDDYNIDFGEAVFDRGCHVKNMGCERVERDFAKDSDDENLNECNPEHAYVLELKFGRDWRRVIRGKKMRKQDVRKELRLRDEIRATHMKQGLIECGLVEEANKIGKVIEFHKDDDDSIRTAKKMMADYIPGMGINPCTMVAIWREEGPPDYPFAQRGDFNTKNICQCWKCSSNAVGGIMTRGSKGNLKKATKNKLKIESLFKELASYRESSDEQNSEDEIRNGDSGFHF